jgi:hypothetical protein
MPISTSLAETALGTSLLFFLQDEDLAPGSRQGTAQELLEDKCVDHSSYCKAYLYAPLASQAFKRILHLPHFSQQSSSMVEHNAARWVAVMPSALRMNRITPHRCSKCRSRLLAAYKALGNCTAARLRLPALTMAMSKRKSVRSKCKGSSSSGLSRMSSSWHGVIRFAHVQSNLYPTNLFTGKS